MVQTINQLLRALMPMETSSKVADLGKGRFATVQCWRQSDKSLVALKEFSAKASIASRKLELAILIAIGTSSCYTTQVICDYKDCVTDQLPYILMAAYVGGPLNKHIQQHSGTSMHISIIRGYVCELVSALTQLEALSCIHRDIKSSNLVLDHTGRLKLCDFGSAIILGTTTDSKCPSRPTTASSSKDAQIKPSDDNSPPRLVYDVTGTAVIMAPEMAATIVGYDCSVDYWAVGVLLYELLTGRVPAWERNSRDPIIGGEESNKGLHLTEEEGRDSEAEVARYALQMDTTAHNMNKASLAQHNPSDSKIPSRPTTAFRQISNIGSDHRLQTRAEKAWFIDSVDPTVGAPITSQSQRINNDLNALLGNFIFTPKKSSDEVALEQAYCLLHSLLQVHPTYRLSSLVSAGTTTNITPTNHATATCPWSSSLRAHCFFNGVDWAAVDTGRSPPANPHFDRRLGCMDLLPEFDLQRGDSEELSEAQQALFDGF